MAHEDLGALIVAWLELLFPRRCLYTGALLEAEAPLPHISQEALTHHLFLIEEPFCHRCGYPYLAGSVAIEVCPNCRWFEPAFGAGRALVHLRGLGRAIVHELKYRHGLHLRNDLTGLFQRYPALADFVAGACLVPVPLHPARLRRRGFNQSVIVAEALRESAPSCSLQDLLVRQRPTATQTRLSRERRARNVGGAFELRPEVKIDPLRRYVIIDDVATTGATLQACARALAEAGANRIDIAAFAHG